MAAKVQKLRAALNFCLKILGHKKSCRSSFLNISSYQL